MDEGSLDGLEELRMRQEVLSFRFQEEPVATEIVSLGFETELPDPDVRVRARASVLLVGLLVGLRFPTDGRET